MKKCFKYENKNALFGKYDFNYILVTTHPSDSVNVSVPSRTSTKQGTTKYSTEASTQASTRSVDPIVSTNSSTGSTQYSSSFGECSLLGQMHENKRDAFIVASFQSIRDELAVGDGPHLAALASLSGCSAQHQKLFIHELRGSWQTTASPTSLSESVTGVIASHGILKNDCKSQITH